MNIWNNHMSLPPVDGNILVLELVAHPQPGGLRHASASISGPQSYKRMKFEAGVHRVQRVPRTEKQGRMHTSTMTVAVLPQPTEVQLYMMDGWHKQCVHLRCFHTFCWNSLVFLLESFQISRWSKETLGGHLVSLRWCISCWNGMTDGNDCELQINGLSHRHRNLVMGGVKHKRWNLWGFIGCCYM